MTIHRGNITAQGRRAHLRCVQNSPAFVTTGCYIRGVARDDPKYEDVLPDSGRDPLVRCWEEIEEKAYLFVDVTTGNTFQRGRNDEVRKSYF